MDTERRMLSRDEVAEELSVSLGTVQNLLSRGDLYATRVGSIYRIPRECLEAFIEGREQPYPTKPMHKPDDGTWPPTPSMLEQMDDGDTDPLQAS